MTHFKDSENKTLKNTKKSLKIQHRIKEIPRGKSVPVVSFK